MTELARSFRTIRVPSIAGATLRRAVGFGQVVKVVSGAQQGLRIGFKHPREERFEGEFSIAADLNGVETVALTEQVWITWPASAESRALVLRSYTAGPGPATSAQQALASVREERIVFSASGQSILKGATSDLIPFRAVDTFVSPAHEVIHRRRFSRFQFWAEISTPSVPNDFTLSLRLRGTPAGTSFDGRRWSKALHGVPISTTEDSIYVEGPIPLTAWKLRVSNPTVEILTVRFMLQETT